MARYHIYFSATRDHYPQHSEHTRVIELENPIEYDSDIVQVQKLAALMVGAKSAMLTHWLPLKGRERYALYHCAACRTEWVPGYEARCVLCSREASPGPLFGEVAV